LNNSAMAWSCCAVKINTAVHGTWFCRRAYSLQLASVCLSNVTFTSKDVKHGTASEWLIIY
jgi:hypothetical protein